MAQQLVETQFVVQLPSGERRPVTVRIGVPYKVDGSEWRCPMEIEGLTGKLGGAAGEDAFQALALAMRFIVSEFEVLREQGGDVYYVENLEPVPLDAYLASGFGAGGPPN